MVSPGLVSFQPSELAKIILTVFLAFFLDLRKGKVNDWKHTLAPIALVAASWDCWSCWGVIWALLWPWLDPCGRALSAGLDLRYFAWAGVPRCAPLLGDLPLPISSRPYSGILNPTPTPWVRDSKLSNPTLPLNRRHNRSGTDGGQAETLLPSRTPDGFHFLRGGRGIGLIGGIAILAVFALILIRGMRASAGCKDDFGVCWRSG